MFSKWVLLRSVVSCVLSALQLHLVLSSHISFYNYFIRGRTQLNQLGFLWYSAVPLLPWLRAVCLSACCASQASGLSPWHFCIYTESSYSRLGSRIFLTIFCLLLFCCVHKSTQCNVCFVFFSQHRLILQGGSTTLCRSALGTETSQVSAVCPSQPLDNYRLLCQPPRAGLVWGGEGREGRGKVDGSCCGLIRTALLSDLVSQVVSIVASKGEDRR